MDTKEQRLAVQGETAFQETLGSYSHGNDGLYWILAQGQYDGGCVRKAIVA